MPTPMPRAVMPGSLTNEATDPRTTWAGRAARDRAVRRAGPEGAGARRRGRGTAGTGDGAHVVRAEDQGQSRTSSTRPRRTGFSCTYRIARGRSRGSRMIRSWPLPFCHRRCRDDGPTRTSRSRAGSERRHLSRMERADRPFASWRKREADPAASCRGPRMTCTWSSMTTQARTSMSHSVPAPPMERATIPRSTPSRNNGLRRWHEKVSSRACPAASRRSNRRRYAGSGESRWN